MLQQTSGKIATVIRQVLDFVKPSSTAVQTSVGGAIREAVELCRTHMNKHGIGIELAIPEGLPPCLAGPGLLEQIFMNVINNAAQALEDHPGDAEDRRSGDSYADGFIDRASGGLRPGHSRTAPREDLRAVLPTRQQGTGIGLAFSRRILDSVGGTIEVGDSPLGGAMFRIRIPAADRRRVPKAD